jgi:hypothetical protein
MQVESYVHVINEDACLELDPNKKILKNLVLVWVFKLFLLKGLNDFTQKSNSLLETRCIVILLIIHL